LPFDHRIGTDFQRLVWKNCALIPFGETRTYQELAHAIGRPKATRAVGTALGANPFLVLIPCHRVLRADGSLGGFAAGLEAKARLLACEKASTS
jgi:O-6-methylguanine DNA methyltransferase